MNEINYGLRNCYYALKDDLKPLPLKGAISLRLDSQIDTQTKRLASNNATGFINTPIGLSDKGYTGTLELASLPDTFMNDVLGYYKDDNGIIIKRRQTVKHFILLTEEQSNNNNGRRYQYLNCTCTGHNINAQTTDEKITPNTITLQLIVSPNLDGIVYKIIRKSDNETIYNDWFNKVY